MGNTPPTGPQGPQGPNPGDINLWKQMASLIGKATDAQKKHNKELDKTNKLEEDLKRAIQQKHKDELRSTTDAAKKYRELQNEIEGYNRKVRELRDSIEFLEKSTHKEAAAAKDAAKAKIAAAERDKLEKQAELDLVKRLIVEQGHQIDVIKGTAAAQEKLNAAAEKYAIHIKAADETLGSFSRNLAASAGISLSFSEYIGKAFTGFSKIKEANRDLLQLQYTMANVGKINFATTTADALSGTLKEQRMAALSMMQEYGVSFSEATKSIANFGTIRPVNLGMGAREWQDMSLEVADLSTRLKITHGVSDELARSLVKQDVQGYGRGLEDTKDTLYGAAAAMSRLKMDADDANSTLMTMVESTALYNTNNQTLIRTLDNVGNRFETLNSQQQRSLALSATQGVAGMGFDERTRMLAFLSRTEYGRSEGLTEGGMRGRLGRLELLQQRDPGKLTAAMIEGTMGAQGRAVLNRRIETDKDRAEVLGALQVAGQYAPGLNLEGYRGAALQETSGRSLREIIKDLSGETVGGRDIQKEAEERGNLFKALGLDQFQVTRERGEIMAGETAYNTLNDIGQGLNSFHHDFLDKMNLLIGVIGTSGAVLGLGGFGKIGGWLAGKAPGVGRTLGGLGSGFSGILGQISTKLSPLLSGISSLGTRLMTGIASLGRFTSFIGPLLSGITRFLPVIGAAIGSLVNVFQGGFDFFNAPDSAGKMAGFGKMIGLRGRGGFEGAAEGALGLGATGGLIGAAVGALFGGVGAAPGALIGSLAGAIIGGLAGFFNVEGLMESIGTKMDEIFGPDSISKIVGGALEGIAKYGIFTGVGAGVVEGLMKTDLMKQLTSDMAERVQNIIDGVKSFIESLFKPPLKTISDILAGWSKFFEPVQRLLNKFVQDPRETVTEGTKNVMSEWGIPDWISNPLSELLGSKFPEKTPLSIPSFSPRGTSTAITGESGLTDTHSHSEDLGVSSGFGKRWGRMHKGTDFARVIGTPIYAQEDMKIAIADWVKGYGKAIYAKSMEDASLEFRYAHLNEFAVKPGQTVRKGQLLGYTGNTGKSTGPHLHFEVRKGGTALDPQKEYGDRLSSIFNPETETAMDRIRNNLFDQLQSSAAAAIFRPSIPRKKIDQKGKEISRAKPETTITIHQSFPGVSDKNAAIAAEKGANKGLVAALHQQSMKLKETPTQNA